MSFLSAAMVGILTTIFPIPEQTSANMPAPWVLMMRAFRYFPWISLVQVTLASIVICSGIAFLRLRKWSRPIMEGVTWLALLYVLAYGAFWLWLVDSLLYKGTDAIIVARFMQAAGVLMIVVFASAAIVIIRLLRGPTVRAALTR